MTVSGIEPVAYRLVALCG